MIRPSSRAASSLSILALTWLCSAAASTSAPTVQPTCPDFSGDACLGASYPSVTHALGLAALHTDSDLLNSTLRRVHRMREIAARATSATMTMPERLVALVRFESIKQDIEYFATTTLGAGYYIANGSIGGLDIQEDPSSSIYHPVALTVLTSNALNLTSLDVSSIASATAAVAVLDTSQATVLAAKTYIEAEIATLTH